jgi:hypothetical protein
MEIFGLVCFSWGLAFWVSCSLFNIMSWSDWDITRDSSSYNQEGMTWGGNVIKGIAVTFPVCLILSKSIVGLTLFGIGLLMGAIISGLIKRLA